MKTRKDILVLFVLLLFVIIGGVSASDDHSSTHQTGLADDSSSNSVIADTMNVDLDQTEGQGDSSTDDSSNLIKETNTNALSEGTSVSNGVNSKVNTSEETNFKSNDETVSSEGEVSNTNSKSSNVLGASNLEANNLGATLAALQTIVNRGGTQTLTQDYTVGTNTADYARITINNDLVLNGNGHRIDANGRGQIFYITGTRTVTFRNLIIANAGTGQNEGGAIYADSRCTLTFENCQFINNIRNGNGAAICIYGNNNNNYRTITCTNCDFIGNTASGSGGAIYTYRYQGLDLTNCNFDSNVGVDGSAIYSYTGYMAQSCTITNCNFTNNAASNRAALFLYFGTITIDRSNFEDNTGYSDGGAINLYGTNNPVYITNSNFTNNKATSTVEDDEGRGGAIRINSISTFIADNCIFDSNAAMFGGGIYSPYTASQSSRITNCKFLNNIGTSNGGAIYWNANGTTFNNNLFEHNEADTGAGIFLGYGVANEIITNCNFTDNEALTTGAAIRGIYEPVNIQVSNSNFKNNSGGTGGAISMGQGAQTITVTNSNFTLNNAQNEGGCIYLEHDGKVIHVTGSNFDSNYAGSGGAIHLYSNHMSDSYTDVQILNCNFTKNNSTSTDASYGGSAIGLNWASDVTINNCKFDKNNASANGAILLDYCYDVDIINTNFTDNYAARFGGAFYTYHAIADADVSFQKIVFNNNSAGRSGGAIATSLFSTSYENLGNLYKNWIITDCNFTNNSAALSAGAAYLPWLVDPNIYGVKFINNTAGSIGALYITGNNLNVHDINFTNNSASTGDAGALSIGQGSTNDLSKFYNLLFINNSAYGNGGAIAGTASNVNLTNINVTNNSAWYGGGLYWYTGSDIIIDKQNYINNSANSGGAIDIYNAHRTNITNVNCENNTAEVNAGAIWFNSDYGTISECNFTNNIAKTGVAGALYLDSNQQHVYNCNFINNTAGGNGGAIYDSGRGSDNSNEIKNCTFLENEAYNGGGAYISDGRVTQINNSTFKDNVASHNGGGAYVLIDNSIAYVDYDLFDHTGVEKNTTEKITRTATGNRDFIVDSYFIDNVDYPIDYEVLVDGLNGIITVIAPVDATVGRNGRVTYKYAYTNESGTYTRPTQQVPTTGDFEDGEVSFTVYEEHIGHFVVTFGFEEDTYLYKQFVVEYDTKDARGDFTILQGYIDAAIANGIYELNLTRSFTYTLGFDEHGNPLDDGQMYINHSFTINGNGFTINGLGVCRIFNITADNVVLNNISFANGVTGFTNSKGVYEGTMGGAIYWEGANGQINDCEFNNNTADIDGGAIFVDSLTNSGKIFNTNFTNNKAGVNGGAIDWNASTGDVENVYFYNNSAKNGGAIFVGHEGENGKVINSTFINNSADTASGHGGAIDWNASHGDVERSTFINNTAYDGGAIFVGESSSTGIIANSTFINNTATKNGGAVDWNASSGFLENSTFINNTADYGGAVFRGGGSFDGSGYNNTFISNHARVNGGAVDWNGTGGNIRDSTFINNTADVNGGAVFVGASGTTGILVNSIFINNSAKEHGGAVDWYASSGDLEDSTFINNSAKYGGAVFVGQASATGKIFNSTFINNTAIENGGAVDWNASSGFLENSTFINNSAKYGGAAYRGGGSYNGSSYNNTFIGNHAEIAGGAVDWAGTAGNIRDTVFINNTAGSEGVDGFGGAVFIGNNGTNGSLVNLTFINNSATRNGGAIDWNSSGGALNDSYLEGNTAVYGGAVFVGGNSSTGLIYNTTFINNNASENGGAIDWNASSGFLEWSTFINNSAKYGGAAYRGGGAYHGSSYNNTFIGNHAEIAGGAVDWASTGGNIRDSKFINNTAGNEASEGVTATDGYGGAVFIGAVASPYNVVNGTIYNVTFINNSATYKGGAVHWNSSGGLVNLSYFENNSAVYGGAVFVGTNSSTSIIYNSTFVHNIAEKNGGAIDWNASSGIVELSTFRNNSADYGGALYCGAKSDGGTSFNNTFMYNHANYNGGAVDWSSAAGNIKDSVFMYNTAGNEASGDTAATEGNGGAVFIGAEGSTGQIINTTFIGNNATHNGGAIDWNATSGYLENSTFTDNHAYDGGALFRGGSAETGSGFNNTFTHNVADHNGGAIYWESSSIKIANYTFTDNIAGVDGGAIYAGTTGEGGSVVNSTFTGNNATTGNGGAIDWAASQGTVENSSFDTNFGKQGGAIHIGANSDEGKISNSNFTNNIATLNGGAVDWNGASGNVSGSYFEDNTAPKGGAIAIGENAEEMTVTDSTFKSNDASEDGGAIYVSQVKNVSVNASSFDSNDADHAGAIYVDNCENFTIDRSNFTANTAVNDGAVHWSGKEGTIKNSVFTNNTATEQGGAVGWKGQDGTISNTTFANNSAADAGGAIVWYGDDTDSIYNSTFESNRAYKGGAIYWIDGNGGILTNSTFKSNVGYDKGGAIMVYNNTNHVIVNSTFDSNNAPGYFNPEGVQYGTGAAIYSEKVSGILIENDTFTNNVAALDGGALALDDTNASKLNNLSITGSRSNDNGGSIYWVNSQNILINDTEIENSQSHDMGGSIYVKDVSGNIENITIDGSTASYGSAGAIYVDGNLTINNAEISNFKSLNDVAGAILFDGGNSTLNDTMIVGKNPIMISKNAEAHLTRNIATEVENGDYTVFNNGDLWLDTNVFENVIVNNGTIETQTYTIVLENSTLLALEGDNVVLNATIKDDNDNIIVVTNELFHVIPEDTAKPEFDIIANYSGFVNYGTYENAEQGVYLVDANKNGLKKNDVQTGVLKVQGRTKLELTVNQTNEGELVVVAATPLPIDSHIYDGTIVFTINGTAYAPIVVQDGKATLTLHDVPAGTYPVNAFYSGDTYHTNATNDTLFIVSKRHVDIDVVVNNIVYGQNATAVANVSNNANGTVIFLLNGRKQVAIDGDHKAVWENISGLVPGNYTITAIYEGNDYFEVAYKEYTFEVYKANSTISATAVPQTVEYRQEQLINIQLNESATGTVKVTINGIEFFADVGTGGKAVVNVTGLPIGEYSSIDVVYSGDDYFNPNSTTVSFGVNPMNVTKISNYDMNISTQDISYGNDEVIEVRLPADATGTVKVLVDGVEVGNKTIGVDNLIFTVPKPGADNQHNVTVIYSGDDIYNGKTNDTAKFKVSPIEPANMTVTVQNITYRNAETIEVYVADDATGNVTIMLNGVQYGSPLELSQGKVKLVIPTDAASFLEVNTYEVTAVYNGDPNYGSKEVRNTFTVSKIASDISIAAHDIDYKQNETVTLGLSVLNASGKVNLTLVNLTTGSVIRSAVFDMETGTKEITFTEAIDAGTYRIDVVYYDDHNYLNSTSSANIVIRPIQSELNESSPNIDYGVNEVITVNVTEGATGTVYITVNGTYYDPVTITNNQAVFTIIKPNAGEYVFTAYYSGDNNYLAKEINGSFNVSKVDTDLSETSPDIAYGSDETITITGLPSDATGTVVVKVDGVVIGNQTIGTDNLVFTVAKPSADNQHNITVIYSGDINYNGKEISGEFKVSEVSPENMTISVYNIKYGEDEIVEVYVADDANGQISITLDGVPYGEAKDLVGGKAIFNLSGLNAKDGYEILAHFASAGNYTDKDVSAKFNVSKAESHIDVTAEDIKAGESETINVALLDTGASGKMNLTIRNSAGDVIKELHDIDFVTTDERGIDYIYDDLALGIYNVTVNYFDDANYFNSNDSFEFVVSFISVEPIDIVYKDTEIISVIAPADATGTVTLTIGTLEANYTITKNLNEAVISGNQANLTFTLDHANYPFDAGRYIVFANYSGDSYYGEVEVKAPFIVSKASSSTSGACENITYGKDELINVTVKGLNDEPITSGFVTITIAGTDISITNPIGSDGVARFNVTGLVVNGYAVNATFSGNENYNASSGLNNFTVSKANITNMDVNAINITYGNDENITVSVADFNASGKVTIEIFDGETSVYVSEKIDLANGIARFSIQDLPISDNYKVVAYYSDDSNYNDMSANDLFKVERATPDVTVTPQNITYGNVETIKITVPNRNATGNITVTIAGITKSVNVTGGVAELNFTGLDVGTYDVTAYYSNDPNYKDMEIPISFTVSKADPSAIVIETQNITYGQVENITVTVSGVDGFAVPTGNVTISVDIGTDIYTNTSQLVNGRVVFNLSGLNASNYRVFATYNGDDKYNTIYDTAPFYVNKAPSSLDVKVANITYGEDELINVTVIGVEDGSTPTLFVTILVNGTPVNMSKEVDSDGIARFNVTGLAAGEYEVNASYSGDNNYNTSSNVAKFNVSKSGNIHMNISAINITYGQEEIITVSLSDENATGNVTISIGTYVDTKEINQGIATFTIPNGIMSYLEANEYTVKANYSGDSNHDAIAIEDGPSTAFTVSKANVTVEVVADNSIYRETEIINVTVTGVIIDAGASGVSKYNLTGKVTIYIDDVENQSLDISQADANGVLHFNVEGLAVGKHNVTAKYFGDVNYNDNNATDDFEVINALPGNMTVNAQNITYHIQNETIVIDLGEVLNGTIQLYINDTLVETFNVIDQRTVQYVNRTLEAGNYTAKAIFTANGDSVEASANFTVSEAPVTVNINAENSTYGETQTIIVTVDNTVGDKFNLTGNVSITINGVNYGNKTVDSNGQAVFEIDGLEANENYLVIANYYNDPNYQDNNGQDRFKVNKTDVKESDRNISAVNITYGEDETITVSLTAENITGKVTIVIGDYTETKELTDGVAVFTVKDLEVNGYNVIANYSGDTNYNGFGIDENLNADFTVAKANSTVAVEAIPTITYGSNETITVSVPIRNHTGTITLTINGTDYSFVKHLTAEDGDTITLTDIGGLAVGIYNVSVTYDGDRNYNDSEASTLFEVIKASPSQVSIETQNITYTEDEIITVTVGAENATGNVTIRIGDYTDTKELENGQVKFNVTGLVVDHYVVEANYSGDANYNSTIVSDIFKVDKAASNITVEVENITFGSTELANITIPNFNASGRVIIKVDGRAYDITAIDNNTPVRLEIEGLSIGNHTIDVEYIEDVNYNNSIAHGEFTVSKVEVGMEITPQNITYGADETIVVRMNDTKATGNVTITIGDYTETKELSSGVAVFTVKDLEVNNYTVVANYSGDANYSHISVDENVHADFEVEKANPDVIVSPINITYGNVETIHITVPNKNATGNITITIAGISKSVNVTGGVAELNFTGLEAGNYDVIAYYSDDHNYNDAEVPISFTVSKAVPTIDIQTQNITYTEDEIITVSIEGIDGDVPTGNVTITIDLGDSVYTNTSELVNGVAKFNVSGLVVGSYIVEANYSGDKNYDSVKGPGVFKVDKAASNITVEVENITYGSIELANITIPNYNASGRVIIKVDGKVYDVSAIDNDTPVKLEIEGLAAGVHTIDVEYIEDVNYNNSIAHAEFNVSKKNITEADITVLPVNITYGGDETITVSVAVENASGKVTITINGTDVELSDSVDGDGKVTFTVPGLVAGDYNVTAKYSDDPNYNDIESSALFTVGPAASSVTVVPVNITYGDDETITVTVPISNATGTLVVKLNGTEINRTVFAGEDSPSIEILVPGLVAGEYNVTAEYDGDVNYKGSNASALFTVSKKNITESDIVVVPVNITYGDDETIEVTVGVENASGKVTITINGTDVELSDSVDEDGKVTFTVPGLSAGEYNVTAKYSDDPNYNDAESSALFTVGPAASSVTVVPVNITYGDDETITVTVPISNATGTLVVKVNGTEVNRTEFNGENNPTVEIVVPGLAAGEYNVTAEYDGDVNYNGSNASALFTVSKKNITEADITVLPVNITYGDDETITVSVAVENASGKVTISINGTDVELSDSVDEDGKVTFTVPGLVAGDYNVTAKYSDDPNYNDIESSALFTVGPAASSVEITAVNITYGENETITVTVPISNATGTLVVKINGTVVNTSRFEGENNPTVEIIVPNPEVGEYNITAVYSDDVNYNDSYAEAIYTVSQADPSTEISVIATNVTYGDNVTVTVTVPEDAKGNITIIIGDYKETKEIGQSNTVEFTVADLEVNNYVVYANYSGDNNYASAMTNAPFHVDKANSTVMAEAINIDYGDNETITVTVPNKNATGWVTVSVNGTEIGSKKINSTGQAEFTVEGLAVGEYDVTVVYDGDRNYYGNENTTEFTVSKADIGNEDISVLPVNITYGDDETIVVTVDVANATGKITITINGTDVEMTEAVDEDGKVTFTVPGLVAGDYNVTAKYSDDPNYNDAESSALFTVGPAASSVAVVPVNITYGADETITVTVPISNATGTLVVKVNGTEVNRTEFNGENNPTVEIVVPGLAAGEYNVTAEYDGDVNYNGSNASALFTVSKKNITEADITVVPVNITYGDDETITVSVAVENASGKVTISINGTDVELSDSVDEDGKVTFTVPGLVAGDYNVTAKYSDDPNYNDIESSALFNVAKAGSTIGVEAQNITYGADETITVTVPISNATGTLVVKVNGTEVNRTEFNGENNPTIEIVVPGLAVGEYNVTAEYIDDANYNDSSNSTVFHVNKTDVEDEDITVVPTNITYPDDETIVVTVDVENATGKVTISINGTDVEITKDVDSDGVATFTVPGLAAGEYNVTARYHDDPNYNDINASALFHVDKASPKVNLVTTNITYGDNETITVVVEGDGIIGNVTIKIEGTDIELTEELDEDGKATFTVPGLAANEYNVNATYNGDDNHNASTALGVFTVDKAKPGVYAVATNISYGENETITVIVDGENLTGNVTIKIDGNEVESKDVGNGRIVFTVPDLKSGEHTVEAIYSGDDNHYGNNGSDTFTVEKINSTLNVDAKDIKFGDVENITVNLPEDASGTVNITVTGPNGYNRTFTDVPIIDGNASVLIDDLKSGDYDVSAAYGGDENYNPSNGIGSFKVGRFDPTMDINAQNITYGDDETITVTLPSDATGTVNITVTGPDGYNKTFADLPVEDGKASVTIPGLNAGDYEISASYSGDANHNPSVKTSDFKVDKASPTIDIDAPDIDYGDDETITVTVPEDATGTVNITVTDKDGNKKTFTDVPIEDGKAIVNVTGLDAGDYDVRASYSGDKNYNPAETTDTFSVGKSDTEMDLTTKNITYGDDETITVTVPKDATGTVDITVTGPDGYSKTFSDVPIENGKASVNIKELDAGTYAVHAEYSGDGNHKKNSTDGGFEVAKADPKLSLDLNDISYGDIERINVTSDAPGTVDITVNGVTVTVSLDNGHERRVFANLLNDYNGRAQLDLENLPVGTYPVKIHYNGDKNHNPMDIEGVFRVTKDPTSISVSAKDIYVGQDAKITVSFAPKDAPGEITITVNGKDYKVSPKDGKASISVSDLPAGTYKVTVSYPGNQNYTKSSNSTTFTVKKHSSTTSVNANDIKVGDDEKITVNVPEDATGTVSITVNGKKITAPVENGKAVFNVPGLKAGDYTVKAKYNGDKKYKPSSGSDTFVVSKVKAAIDSDAPAIKEGENATVTVTVPEDATGTVTIVVDGKEYTAPVKDGKAVFNVPGLKKGTYDIKVSYSGDDKYAPATDAVDLDVKGSDDNNGTDNHTHSHNPGKGINLADKATGNPLLALVVVLSVLGIIPLGRKKEDDDEEDEEI